MHTQPPAAPGLPGLRALSRSVAHIDIALLAGAAGLGAATVAVARRSPATRRMVATGLGGVGVVTAVTVRLVASSGVTDAEVAFPRPGDSLVSNPRYVIDRGVTIHAPAATIWPWIVQMGYHRGGWYTNVALDRLIWHLDNPSVDRIVPELQALAVGDVVPDGPPGTAYWKIATLEPERAVVYLDDDGVHVPGTICSWAWFLDPVDERTTRVLTRSRFAYPPTPRMEVITRLLVGPADFVMTGQMLRGIKQRAERMATAPAAVAP